MTTTIVSRTNRAIDITLDHPAFRTKECGYRVTSQATTRRGRDGRVTGGTVRRAHPGSIRLPAGGEVSGLHPAIRHCAQVRQLLAQGLVALVDAEDASLPAAPETGASSTRRRARVPEPPAGD